MYLFAALLFSTCMLNDLPAGNCQIRPGVETATKVTAPKLWLVNGVARAAAYVVSQISGSPAYGGTPSNFSVVQAIQELKARGFRVTFYPFLLMDVPAGNTRPTPYSNNAAMMGQPKYPWRGRITCSPAAGFAGTVDKTAAAAGQVSAFFGAAAPATSELCLILGDGPDQSALVLAGWFLAIWSVTVMPSRTRGT